MLLLHLIVSALLLARANAGNNSPARIAMMAMTTRSSIRVKAACSQNRLFIGLTDIVPSRQSWQVRTCRVHTRRSKPAPGTAERQASPLSTASTAYPSSSRTPLNDWRIPGSSSTTRIVGFFEPLQNRVTRSGCRRFFAVLRAVNTPAELGMQSERRSHEFSQFRLAAEAGSG